jgi:hypothetical protein
MKITQKDCTASLVAQHPLIIKNLVNANLVTICILKKEVSPTAAVLQKYLLITAIITEILIQLGNNYCIIFIRQLASR